MSFPFDEVIYFISLILLSSLKLSLLIFFYQSIVTCFKHIMNNFSLNFLCLRKIGIISKINLQID
jgi:hypothetical protein